jgi:hypothetical protein
MEESSFTCTDARSLLECPGAGARRSKSLMRHPLSDVRFGIRQLRNASSFTIAAIVPFPVAIGANAVVKTSADA